MKIKTELLKNSVFSLLFAAVLPLYGEMFRVAQVKTVVLPQSYEDVSLNAGIFDGVSVKLPEDTTFISGIEINIKVPEIVASWRDSVACTFYQNVSPSPSSNVIDYSATRVSLTTIPGRLNHTIYVPLNSKFSVKESPYAKVVETINELTDNSVFFRFQLAMKGAPEALESAEFELSVKPVLSNEGKVKLTVNQPDNKNEPYSVYIDDKAVTIPQDGLIVKSGEHHLSLTSQAFRNEVRTFIVENAKTTNLNVLLRGIEPLIKIVCPQNASVTLDGQPVSVSENSFVITPETHTVKFNFGDYEITKTLNAINGRSYTVNLNVDASISEEE